MVLEFIGAAGVAAIVGAAWKLGRQIEGMEKHFTARLDGMEARLGNLEAEVRSINDHLRRRSE